MPVIIGIAIALGVALLGRVAGLERERSFYTTITIVVAHYYLLFATMAGLHATLVLEAIAGGAFVIAAVIGYRSSMWIVAAALAGHGVFDFFHDALIHDPGVPAFWPSFCMAYDVVAGAYLAWCIRSGRIGERA